MSVANTELLIFDTELLKERDYWTDRLAGVSATASLPPDYQRSRDYSHESFVFELPDPVFQDLVKLTGPSSFLQYTTLLAAAKICLHKYTNTETIVVGSPALKELGRANLLPVLSKIDTEISFRQFLLTLRETLLEAYARQSYPFDYLIRDLKLENPEGRYPLCELIVRLKDIHGDIPDLRNDLTLTFESSTTEIFGLIEFNPNLYSRGTIATFADHFVRVLEEALENKDKRLVDFQMLTANERQRLLGEWNQTAATYVAPLCLHQIFEAQVERSPQAGALQSSETQLSYAELNVRANQLAHFLREQGIGPEVPVGICMERSVEMVMALLAVLKAGGAYVPIDPAYPLERLRYVMEEINAPIVLTQTTVSERLPAHWGLVVSVDHEPASFASFPKENPQSNVLPENPAYVIYTSGSTGKPKGVIVPHAGLGNFVAAQSRILRLEPENRVLQFASLGFDASISDMLLAWGSGGTVCLVPQNSLPLGQDLHQLLIDYAVTAVTLPPTALMTLPVAELPDLSTITVAGEPCSAELVDRWAPGRRFFNLYGPTEATIWSTAAECGAGAGKPAIGRPIDNVEVYILDERKEPVPTGVAGELHVGGIGLARGYWGRPDLTAEKFVPHPYTSSPGARLYRTGDVARFRSDGQIDFLGRMDHQVKVRGFRIELGEIEAVLKQHPGVQDAVVILREDKPDQKRIVAYIVSDQEPPPATSALLRFLQQKLPEFMLPQAFVVIDRVPLTPNGKVDRRLLLVPEPGRPNLDETFVEPSGEAEQALARIWSELLRVETIGSHDDFFALGGDSILAMLVAARADQAGLHLMPKHIFQHHTIAELALVAGTSLPIEAEQGLVTGPVPLTPIQYWFFEQDLPERHHYNQSVMLEVQEPLDPSSWKQVVQHLLRRHDALRMRYLQDETGWRQFNAGDEDDGDGDVGPFEYFDLSGLTDEQQTATIEAQANALQASLNLADGPLVRVALFHTGLNKAARLLVVIHHLVVDGVSFRIILEHLQTGYEQARRGEPIDFGGKTTSFKHWAQKLTEYARSGALETEKPYWLAMASSKVAALPVDFPEGTNSIESARRIQVSLGVEETRALLQEVPPVYNTQINDVLLTAVAQAFRQCTGQRQLLISLEGHGREEISEDIDVSRTVGWFTSESPVLLTLAETESEFESLLLVKEQLRAVPQRGIGYGLLRYLSDDDEVRSLLGRLVHPEVSFNYLGQFDQALDKSSLFRIAGEAKGQTLSSRGNLPHLLQINGSIIGGRLQLTWTYSENVFSRTTVERLGDSFLAALRALIAHCQSPAAGGYTPSDFPLTRLSQAELDHVVGKSRQIEDIYPLSTFQQGLLFHTLFTPGRDVYFTQLSGTIDQPLDVVSFRRALQRVIDRHPILRTAFVWERVSEPLQVVHKQVELPWQQFDWRAISPAEQEAQLEAFLETDRQRDFMFSEAPVMRCALVRLGEDRYRFVWSFHHLLLDGWALFQVAREVFTFYDAFAEGSELSLPASRPFGDYIAWLQRQDRSREETFWRRALKGFSAPTSLVVDRIPGEQTELEEPYYDQRLRLSAATTEALKSLARKHQLTLNTIVQGIYGLLLGRYSGENDVVFGATTAGRPATLLGVESMIGIFINTLPVRVRISPEERLLPWLKRLQEQQAEVQEYEYSSLAQVQGWSNVPRGKPLFESILVFENFPIDASLGQRQGKLNLIDVKSFDRANYPLTIGASPGRQLMFRFSYDRRRFEDETITRMFGHLETLLEAVVANPQQRLIDLPLLTDAEQRLLVQWNETATPSLRQLCLHELFEDQVRRLPQAVALQTREEQLSYAELNQRANQLAHFLREQGVGAEVMVGICMERSAEMVVSMLAVLKAGGVYVPLDPEYPLERLRYMMDEINAWVVLTQERLAERLPAHWGQVVSVDSEGESFTSFPDENPVSGVSGDNLANLIFTSGSTGLPKASMVTHRGLCNTILHRTEALSLTDEDRFLQTNSFSFDASVWEFFAPLAIGGQLIMLRPGGYKDPAYIVSMLAEHQVTTVEFPPSWLRMVLEEPGLADCRHLKHVICGGQILTAELQARFYSRLGSAWAGSGSVPQRSTWDGSVPQRDSVGSTFALLQSDILGVVDPTLPRCGTDPIQADRCGIAEPIQADRDGTADLTQADRDGTVDPIQVAQLHNYYGPSEASIDATGYTCQPDAVTRTAPIGRPISNVQVYILDDLLRPVPAGVPGELHIGGEGLARGYLNQAAMTAEKFIPNPFAATAGARLYKTGDVARYLPDGVIEFCGRNDDQVKIRGFRIELGEVEAVLVQHPEVLEAAVVAREDTPGDKRLVAYVVAAATIEELRSYMKEKLPEHMVPALFVLLEKLPRNLNGKVDREALPMPDLSRPQLETPFVAPRNAVEQNLAEIWVEVLGVQQVGIEDSFFALGGDSIRSVQVLSKAQQRGLSFSLQSIFQHHTIRGLAGEVTTTASSEATLQTRPFSLVSAEDRERLPEDAEDAYPLSLLQAGMIFHTEYHPDSAVYHSISSRRIKAKLDLQALETAINRIVEQHPTLRTSFHLNGFSEPLQVVHRRIHVPVPADDLRHLPASEQERIVAGWLEVEKLRPFNWTQVPLLRFHVHRYTDETFQFTFTAHHSMLDGWSDSIVFAELFKRYVDLLKGEAEAETAPPAIPYREFVWLERAAMESEATRNFWSEQLRDSVAGVVPRWTTPDGERSVARLSRVVIPVSEALSDGLKQLTQITGAPIKDVLLAAHLKVMSLLAGQPDVTTGLISNGRPEATDGDRIVGLFLNTLPFRMKLPKGSWLDLINQVFATENEILPHRRYPLARIQRDQGGQSLFETAFNYTQFHLYQGLQDVEVQVLDSISVAETNFTLVSNFSVGIATNQIQAVITCNAGELHEDQIRAIVGYYARTLEAMAANPQQDHDSISLLGEEERRQLLSDWNSTTTAYPQDHTLPELFEAQVERTPDAIAVVFEDEVLTYRELNSRANKLAHHLRRRGVGAETRVGLCLNRSVDMLVGLIGIWKAGGVYVPLDPMESKARFAFMIADSRAQLVLSREDLKPLFSEQGQGQGTDVIYLDSEWAQIVRESEDNPKLNILPENLAYVVYTSGSTGQPKGAMIEHRSVVNLTRALAQEIYSPAEPALRLTLNAPLAFDSSIKQIVQLLAGHALYIVPEDVRRDGGALLSYIRRHELDALDCTPSQLRLLVQARTDQQNSLPRILLVAGEALGKELWQVLAQEETARAYNVYGPTECTVDATACRVDKKLDQPAIGRPLANIRTYVLDDQLRPVPVGTTGELHIAGAGLARGYLDRPGLTAEKFIPNPFSDEPGARMYKTGDLARYLPDGNLVFAGRADEQVKLRGFRIELGEIEAALCEHFAVQDAVVLVQTDESDEKRLVAYVVAELELAADELRRHLKEKLPSHMAPQGFMVVDHLPLSSNGKIDRRALPAWEQRAVKRDESTTGSPLPVEDMLAGIWQEVLKLDQVGVADNFFDLGGHSLLATQVISRVRETFKTEIPLRSLFEAPTLTGFAAVVQTALRESHGLSVSPIKRVARDIALPLSFAQQRLWFVDQFEKGGSFYNIPSAVRLKGELNVAALERAFNELIRRHETLRTRFALVAGKPVQVVASSLTLPIPLVDLSGLSEISREAEARRLASEFVQGPFDLSSGPLLRASLIRVAAEEHIALFVIHHIITDGWSMGVLVREIAALYEAFIEERPSPLTELPVQYADFASWQREWLQGDVLESQLDYWRRQLGPHAPELLLPLDRPRPPVQTHNGAHQSFAVPPEIQRGLKALSRREGVTMFMTLLAAFKIMLYRYSSQEDIIVGTDMANRNRAETENVIGFFVNMLVLRTGLSGNPSFRELLKRVREVALGAYAHQDLPFEKLVDEFQPVRDPSRNPLFQAVFVLQNTPARELKLPGLSLSPFRLERNNVQFDLIFSVSETRDAIEGGVAYNTDLFDGTTIDEMVSRFQNVLQLMIEDPDQHIADLRLISETWTNGLTPADFPDANLSQKDFENILAQLGTT